jgi:hypothetical protein
MTICVVARCIENDSFVLAGDRMFSYGKQLSYESISLKRVGLTYDGRWHTMFAADPVANVLPVVRRARQELRHYRPPHRLDLVERACVRAYQAQRVQIINDTILSMYGIDLQEYRSGALKFHSKEIERLNFEIEHVMVGLELIVFGYDDLNQSHLFTVTGPGESTDHEQDGFAVAGCGSGHALHSLLQGELDKHLQSQAEMLCRVCEAKFDAEKDDFVGKDSAVGVLNRPGNSISAVSERFISIPAISAIRLAYKKKRRDRPYPQPLLEAITDELDCDITSERMSAELIKATDRIRRENKKRRAKNRAARLRRPS